VLKARRHKRVSLITRCVKSTHTLVCGIVGRKVILVTQVFRYESVVFAHCCVDVCGVFVVTVCETGRADKASREKWWVSKDGLVRCYSARQCFLPLAEQWVPFPLPGSLMPGPAGPKHPDGERLFPYQSGNTAPPPHPLYKKHDSTVPKKKKCRKNSQTPGFVKSPLHSFYRKRKISREQRGVEMGGGCGEKMGVTFFL